MGSAGDHFNSDVSVGAKPAVKKKGDNRGNDYGDGPILEPDFSDVRWCPVRHQYVPKDEDTEAGPSFGGASAD